MLIRVLPALLIALGAACPAAASDLCFTEAADHYHVPESLLRAISHVESRGNTAALNSNRNGSYDIGHMQINSSWLPTLRQYGIDERQLWDPCLNTFIGAWVLADNIARLGFTWNAVGAYNAASPALRRRYASSVARVLRNQR